MKRILTTVLIAGVMAAHIGAADEYLDWTSTQGSTIRAKFVGQREGKVTLLKEGGEQMVIRRIQLSDASRKQADDLVRKMEEEAAAAVAGAGKAGGPKQEYKVKAFEAGPWKGRHAYYEREKFVAVAETRGHIRIYMKHDGKRIRGAPSCHLYPSLLYYPDGETQIRKIVLVESDAEPSESPKKLTFSGVADSGTTYEVSYVFKDDSIAVYGHLRDPDGIDDPTRLHIGVRFPKHTDIEPEMSEDEKRKIVGDSYLKAKAEDGTELEFDYLVRENLNANEKVKKGLEWVRVKPAISGPHVLKLTPPAREYGTLRIWNGATSAPYMGFGVSVYRKDSTERSARARVLVEIE